MIPLHYMRLHVINQKGFAYVILSYLTYRSKVDQVAISAARTSMSIGSAEVCIQKLTAPEGVPRRSPTPVLTGPCAA